MKYYEVDFTIVPCSQDAQDILSALAGEAGFETFEETATGLKGYVQQTLFDEEVLNRKSKTRTGTSNGNRKALNRSAFPCPLPKGRGT